MMDPLRTIKGKHADAEIHLDPHPSSPREWSNVGSIAALKQRNFDIGDETFDDPNEFLLDLLDRAGHEDAADLREAWDEGEEEEEAVSCRIWDAAIERYVLMSLHFRDFGSGGVRMRADTNLDSDEKYPIGFVYCTIDKAREEWADAPDGVAIAKAQECMAIEVSTYQDYINGEVYGIVIRRHHDGDHFDSCWGFFLGKGEDLNDDDCYVMQEARSMLAHAEARLARHYIYDPDNMTPFGGRHDTYTI